MNRNMVKGMIVFAAIAEKGSMSAAATQLNLSSSAVSQQVAKLEMDMGISLFHRNTRHLTLTEAGTLFYENCIKIIKIVESAEHQLHALKGTPSGELKIAAPVGFGGGLLSQPLAHLLAAHPQISLNLQLQDGPIDIVNEGIDLAICIGPLSDSNLIARPLADWRMLLCVAPNYIPQHQHLQHPDELQGFNRISHSYAKPEFLTHSQTQERIELPAQRINVNNMQTLIQLTLDGLGYAVLPEPEVHQYLASGQLVTLLPDWSLRTYSVYSVTSARDKQPAKVKEAIAALSQYFSQMDFSPNPALLTQPSACVHTPRLAIPA
ncbi:LysR family transcriptional regulator [Shewanella bicestrii]|uniref:LysR family transcriptional regulator n=1 Tax=Shewanella sp. GD03713 TaxID=2975372 RepID=UPI000B341B1A|nr:LysR family transcriptional regulator [Shewanella sp. GD03713]MDH1472195.1 LysR family transcriptional regulator [Shewanella sp. GD03713]QXN24819.1 LysR family transcriptional regulator [Shewanella putrefaciens]VEE61870.1 D-malate degradation protein R [Shewanella putrefaciens]